MVSNSSLKYLLSDHESLLRLMIGEYPSMEDIKMRLLQILRNENRNLPDHYYRLNQESNLAGLNNLSDLIRIGLYRLSKEYLELKDNRIYVQSNMQTQWQELITHIPPLVLQMAFLHIERPLINLRREEILEYYNQYILPNTKYTALPYADITQLEDYLNQSHGFYDLHIHLNGSSETDIVWQDCLSFPVLAYKKFKNSFKGVSVRSQIEQELFHGESTEFRKLLFTAQNIRQYFFVVLFSKQNSVPVPEWLSELYKNTRNPDFLSILNYLSDDSSTKPSITSYSNPFASIVLESDEVRSPITDPLSVEGLMYILLFNYLCKYRSDALSIMIYYYLQIYGLTNRLLVQQTHQFGFEQFQKITNNDLRSFSEDSSYLNRYLQLHGNDLRNISILEGRFSPKDNLVKTLNLLHKIENGWTVFIKKLSPAESPQMREIRRVISRRDHSEELLEIINKQTEYSEPELRLIAHFIKEKDRLIDSSVRHQELRYKLYQRARVLALAKKNYPKETQRIIGIDAAANELDAPPEVFAPIFRYLRRCGFNNFTYHAGEDFYHIIGGLRAIYETVEFCELTRGNRLGHATASGISPSVWIRNIEDNLWIKKGDYLDDLIFAYSLIINEKCHRLEPKLMVIRNRI